MDSMYKDGTYLANNPNWHEQDSPWKAGKIAQLLAKNGVCPSTVCEIGCGAGGILSWLSEHDVNETSFFGYEISPQAFELCRKKATPRLHFFHKNLFEDSGAWFDVVMAIDVFEHVEDYFGFLRNLQKKASFKVFHIPLDLSVQTVLRGAPIMRQRLSVGHIHYFTKETALASLQDTGYEVIDYVYTNASELPNRNWKSKLLRVPREILFWINQDMAARLLGGFSLMVLAK
jgi:hypothetical protein